LNTNPDFLIWGEHNGFLRHVAAAYYDAAHPRFPDKLALGAEERIKRLRDPSRWPAWDNLCGEAEFLDRFQAFFRSIFADPTGRASRWGFKEIRYPGDASDQALRFTLDCFPETRLIVLIREPEPTLFSMLSRWAFDGQRNGDIDLDDLDQRILAAAALWNLQYMCLQSLIQTHRSNCLPLRYEELGSARTYQKLARFLETSSFDYARHISQVKDASNKTDPTARLITRRIEFLHPQIAAATSDAREAYGYSRATHPPGGVR
jgi:hypothetical protein